MPQIDVTRKICMRCGTNCNSLVLVCPNCSEVLPDGKLPARNYVPFEFTPENTPETTAAGSGSSNELVPGSTSPATTPVDFRSSRKPILQSISYDTTIIESAVTLLGIAIVIMLIAGWQKQFPG